MGLYFCPFLLNAKSGFFKTSSIYIFYLFDVCFMQRAGRVLKSFGVKSYKLLLIIHFLTQHTLNLSFLFVFFFFSLNIGIIFSPVVKLKSLEIPGYSLW